MKKLLVLATLVAAALASAAPASAMIPGPPIPGPKPPIPDVCGVNVHCRSIKVAVISGLNPGQLRGNGRVTTQPAGIDCVVRGPDLSGRCDHEFTWPLAMPTLRVTVTWLADADSNGSGGAKTFDVEPKSKAPYDVTLSAGFQLNAYALNVGRSGAGTGRVTSSLAGVDCGAICSGSVNHGTRVSLVATPDAGALFREWTGACAGQGLTCSLTVTQASTTTAVFGLASDRQPQPSPQPQPQPSPRPTPQPQPAPDTNLLAEVIGHKLGRSALGFRLVRIELELDERLAATVTLTRGGRTLLTKQVATLAPGKRVVTLVLPNRIVKGSARLVVHMRDADGNKRSWSRSVLIGRRSK